MRSILIAGVMAAGLGIAATSGSVAAPVNGAVVNDLANAGAPVTQVYWRRGGHWRWGSHGGHWRWGSHGGHWRWHSHG